MKIGILGADLIGAGIGMELRAALGKQVEVVGFDDDTGRLNKAHRAGAFDAAAPAIGVLATAEIIFVSGSSDTLQGTLRSLAPHLRPGVVVSDLGSVKAPGNELAEQILAHGVVFIGSHLIEQPPPGPAGSSQRVWCLTPGATATGEGIEALRDLAIALDYRPLIMMPDEHDRYVAATQQLSVLARAALLEAVAGGPGWQDLAPFAGYLQAASQPRRTAAAAELEGNAPAIVHSLDRLQEALTALRTTVASADRDEIERVLNRLDRHEAAVAPSEKDDDGPAYSRSVVESLLGSKTAQRFGRRK